MSNKDINNYIKKLATTEEEKSKAYKNDPRHKILVHGGVLLNWLGDYFANPSIKWEKVSFPTTDILMTGVDPKWNELFIAKCKRESGNLTKLINKDTKLKSQVAKWADLSRSSSIILVRKDKEGYKVLDGMHRFVKHILDGKEKVEVYMPVNEASELPYCEPHVIYDLIRGFQCNAHDKQGGLQLKHALMLLSRTYSNVSQLLRSRFNKDWVPDKDVQRIIKVVLGKKF